MNKKDYKYQDNMHVIEKILDNLMITRTIQEIKEFDKSIQMVYLQMFPCVNEQADIVEDMFNKYSQDYNVKQWYESLFKIKLKKIENVQ